jgi:hypothetical protein
VTVALGALVATVVLVALSSSSSSLSSSMLFSVATDELVASSP